MTRLQKTLMLATDLGFAAYWLVTALGIIPAAYLFKDYHDPFMVSWNWSFLPIDLLASASGLAGVALGSRGRRLADVSLALTFCAGGMALSFWAMRGDFDPAWWLANGFLAAWPLPFLFARRRED